MIRILGNTALGFVVSSALISIAGGTFLMTKNLLSEYEFNLHNALVILVALFILYVSHEVGVFVTNLLKERKDD